MTSAIEDVVLGTVKERFGEAVIDSVSATPGVDHDGDPIVRVTVVFNAEINDLEVRELTGLGRRLRPRLAEQGETGFPIMRFLTKRDWDRLRHEAA
jgi:hypothetical protein